MFCLHNDMSIEITQGDVGSFLYHLDNFELTNEDKCSFIVYNKNGIALKKNIENLIHGIGYFVFDSEDTKRLSEGTYYYDIICDIVGVGTVTTHSQIEFKIRRGFTHAM